MHQILVMRKDCPVPSCRPSITVQNPVYVKQWHREQRKSTWTLVLHFAAKMP